MAKPRMVSVCRLQRMERHGYARFSSLFWQEVLRSGEKRLTPYLLSEILKFEHVAMTPLPIKKIPGGYFFSSDDQLSVLRGYEDAMLQLAKARATRI